MRNDYKVPWHIRQFVKKELLDYKHNKAMLDKCQSTRELIIAYRRIEAIEKVYQELCAEDKQAMEIIFYEQYSQIGAEMQRGLSKRMYYHAMNKIIYLTAVEFDLV